VLAASIIRAMLMMEATSTSEMSVNFNQTTLCYNPEGSNLHTHCCENPESYFSISFLGDTA
jgi:hypothetical protein